MRVAEKVKKRSKNIKTIHYVAPQVWVWRKNRVKKFKKFLDHILLLFNFEKKYFDKENIPNTFVGHPLLNLIKNIKLIFQILFLKIKKLFLYFLEAEYLKLTVLLPILIDFIKLMNKNLIIILFIFHATDRK